MKQRSKIKILIGLLIVLALLVTSKLCVSYTINLHGVIEENLAASFIEELKFAQLLPIKQIKIDIDSPGGSIEYGFKMIDEINRCILPIKYYISGKAYSMATVIVLNAKPHTVFISKHSFLMFHVLKNGIGNENNKINKLGLLDPTMEDNKFAKNRYNYIEQLLIEKIGLSANQLSEKLNQFKDDNPEEYFVPANKAIELNLVDGIY